MGGERLLAGSRVLIQWDSADDKGIQSQWVELSTNGGATYSPLAILSGTARLYNWQVTATPTTKARIKIRVLDGVNAPVTVSSPADFEIAVGPPDTTPPRVTLVSPADGDTLAAGSTILLKWTESDNLGVIRRAIDLSTDGGETFRQLAATTGPSTADPQTMAWSIPGNTVTNKGKIRVTVFDGSNNSATVTLGGKFQIWGPPTVTEAAYKELSDGRQEFRVAGKNFRLDETEIYIDGLLLRKIRFFNPDDNGDGTFNAVYSYDKKLFKRLPLGTFVNVVVKLPRTGQESAPFQYKRKAQ
jgi:hypothetical protein